MEIDKKYSGILEKKWTSVIRLQKKVKHQYDRGRRHEVAISAFSFLSRTTNLKHIKGNANSIYEFSRIHTSNSATILIHVKVIFVICG